MPTACKISILVGLLALLASAPAKAAEPTILRAETADSVLKPGDVLLNYLKKKSPLWGKAIGLTQRAIQKIAGVFNKVLRKGDANAVHAALYLGNGKVAEAWGTRIGDAKVTTWSLNHHSAEPYAVWRPRDRALAARAVAIARRWATGKMRFLPPFHVPFRSSSFGPKARKEALRYGRGANRRNGPRGISAMFCSYFVLAAYQAAAVAPQLAHNPRLSPDSLRLPRALRLQASHSSVMALLAQFRSGSDFFEVGRIQVDPTLPPLPSILTRLGQDGKLLLQTISRKLGLDRVAKAARRGWAKAKSTLEKVAAKVRGGAKKAYQRAREGAKKVLGSAGKKLKKAGQKIRGWFKKWF